MLGLIGRAGRKMVVLCAIVLVFCASHQLLATSRWHAAMMAPRYPSAMSVLKMADEVLGVVRAPEAPPPAPSQPWLGDCPVEQGIPPFLLALTFLLGLWPSGACALVRGRGRAKVRWLHHRPPPLLPAPQRRALLQVFTI